MTGVYAVIGGSDGVGTTTATAALGASLAERTHRVAVIDGDRDGPSLGGAVGVTADGPTVETALRGRASLLDATYRVSRNLDAVPGDGSDDGNGTRLGAAADLVAAARERYDEVLVDVGAGETLETALWAALADRALFVSTPDDDALAGVATGRHAVEYLGTPVEGVVLNRVAADDAPDVDAVAARVDAPVVAALPYDEAAVASSAVGAPVIDHDPDSPVAAACWELAGRLGDGDLADDPVVPAALADGPVEGTAAEDDDPTASEDAGRSDDGFDWAARESGDDGPANADSGPGTDEQADVATAQDGEDGGATPTDEEAVAAAFKERMDNVRDQQGSDREAEQGRPGEGRGLLTRLLD
ncbi:MinD/ParA family ATP-binding protein [Halostella litorea]|uniref:MinD/ParA family ATP-binding protein n=1 Tax=Halostella litorea TaxID=2528831 RepID=UPI001386F9D4|nr:hypothetical protein [Halostella litorea]